MLGLPVSTAVTGALFIALPGHLEGAVEIGKRAPSLPDEVRLAPQRATRPWGRAWRCTARSSDDL
jgi:hypothetical protein